VLRWSLVTSLALLSFGCGSDGPSSVAGNSTDGSSGAAQTSGGSDGVETGTSTGADSPGYHPPGFAAPEVHGMAMKLHEEDCRTCHGEDLKGGVVEQSCDSCHTEGWRTDCTYCHGGTNNQTGAPPRDIDGMTTMLSFAAHGPHVTETLHAAYGCEQCHVTPTDVLSEGHVFDDTDAMAEVYFVAGLSPAGQWDGNACSNLYCHGNGNGSEGSYAHDQPAPSCGGCHPYPGTENMAYQTMSGRHALHMGRGLECAECHDPQGLLLHVDGKPDVEFAPAGFTFDPTTRRCSGTCHGRVHVGNGW